MLAWCCCLPRIWSRRILYRYFLVLVKDFFSKSTRIDAISLRMILVHSGTTAWCYFLLLLAAVIVRLFAPDRDSCVLALCCGLPPSRFNEAFLRFPFGSSRGVLFIFVGYSFFFRYIFQPKPTLDLCESTTKITARLIRASFFGSILSRIRTYDTCAHTYKLDVYITIQLQ